MTETKEYECGKCKTPLTNSDAVVIDGNVIGWVCPECRSPVMTTSDVVLAKPVEKKGLPEGPWHKTDHGDGEQMIYDEGGGFIVQLPDPKDNGKNAHADKIDAIANAILKIPEWDNWEEVKGEVIVSLTNIIDDLDTGGNVFPKAGVRPKDDVYEYLKELLKKLEEE